MSATRGYCALGTIAALGDDDPPFEPKASAWGWLNDKPVAIDYGNVD